MIRVQQQQLMFCFSALLKPHCIGIFNCEVFGLLCNKRLLPHISASRVSFSPLFCEIANKRFARKFFGQSAILDRSDDYGDYATFKQNLLIDLKINTKTVIWSLLLSYPLLSYRFVAIVVIFIVTSEYLIFFNTMIFT